uniref:Retrotransposon protein, putative, Ty1-copia subclass n=1 Tax=Tanacetum cinerariifolium TaxID=118510 RepID=A0A6L2MBB2_TANCI|nr:retrotransposon protein, putative, Ty1-copia subclass [Tanacetum cinerariifolium]
MAAKGNQGKGKVKMDFKPMQAPPFAPKPKNPPTPKKDNPAKDAICHQRGEIGHWRRNCTVYVVELLKKKKLSQGASTSGIFTIELYSFLSTSWVYDTGYDTDICITTQGLRGSKKQKLGALSLYVGDGHHTAVEAIEEFHLCLPSGLVLILHNCHYAPSIIRDIISVSRLHNDGFVNRFENDNSIIVSRNNLIYFNAIPRDDIYEIVLSSSNTNDSSMYVVSNKRAKLNLDSALLWHCCLGHISKKCIKKLQHDRLLDSTNIKSFEKFISCMSGKMARKSYSHQVERATDLLGLIHTDEHGIISHRTPPYTPQHNGVLERRNRTLLDMVRSMMSQTTLPKSFWDYALESAARIVNMVPTKKVDKTPYEMQSMRDNEVWELVDLPPSGKTIGHKWFFKRKTNMDGAVHTYKACLTGYVFVLNGGVGDWKSTKQSLFATLSTHVEYIAAFEASEEVVWIRKFISGLGVVPTVEEPINMYCDNTRGIAIAKDHGVTKGATHFRAKVYYLRETIEMGNVKIEKVDTDDNLADPFTKALTFPKHSELTKKIGMIPASSLM